MGHTNGEALRTGSERTCRWFEIPKKDISKSFERENVIFFYYLLPSSEGDGEDEDLDADSHESLPWELSCGAKDLAT